MKIDKKLIKELSEYLDEFNLTEIEFTENNTKIKVSKNNASVEQFINSDKETRSCTGMDAVLSFVFNFIVLRMDGVRFLLLSELVHGDAELTKDIIII